MIRVYITYYEKDSAEYGKASELEHRLGRELLCRGLKELYGLDVLGENGSVDSILAIEENGKPYIKDRPDIHFNISHCSGMVVCAFADQPIGVDAEAVKPVRDPLIRRVLHEQEIQVLSRYGEIAEKGRNVSVTEDKDTRSQEFLRLFFRYWTLKESWLKQDGSGLTREPRELCFFVDPDDWTSPVRASDPGKICLQRIIDREQEARKEYVISVCVPCEEECPDMEIDSGLVRPGKERAGIGNGRVEI